MIGYTLVGVNDYPKALDFYDALLAEIGGKRVMDLGNGTLYGFSKGAMFGIIQPYNGKAAAPGNGAMVALNVGSKDNVAAVYNKAMAMGATDEGPVGPRGDSFYAGYFRDLDGNKICAFTM